MLPCTRHQVDKDQRVGYADLTTSSRPLWHDGWSHSCDYREGSGQDSGIDRDWSRAIPSEPAGRQYEEYWHNM